MIQRRGFFSKLAAVFGLSSLPAQASEKSVERIMLADFLKVIFINQRI